jgi:hypothetical protein
MASAGDIYRNCKSMVHSCYALDGSVEMTPTSSSLSMA